MTRAYIHHKRCEFIVIFGNEPSHSLQDTTRIKLLEARLKLALDGARRLHTLLLIRQPGSSEGWANDGPGSLDDAVLTNTTPPEVGRRDFHGPCC